MAGLKTDLAVCYNVSCFRQADLTYKRVADKEVFKSHAEATS
jgi:hypothetical protein